MRIPKVFVGGPWSKPDPEENVRLTAKLFMSLWNDGKCFPICPMLEQHLIHSKYQPIDYDEGLSRCYDFINMCDAAIFRAGESSGKTGEILVCREYKIIHFENDDIEESKKELYQWIEKTWKPNWF